MADKRRTKTELQANEFDRKLYALIEEARLEISGHPRGHHWHKVWCALRSARPHVRDLMHPTEREGTEG